jgi:hypothetical protein
MKTKIEDLVQNNKKIKLQSLKQFQTWRMHWRGGCQLLVKPVKEKTSWT